MKAKTASRSRLLATLEAAIKAAPNPVEAQCLRAERAALLARQGQLERAQGVIDELNSQLGWQANNNVLRAWVALAEGLHGYYSVIGREADAMVEQADALARTTTAVRLRATAAAWRANMAFNNEEEWPRMAALVREALDIAAAEHHGARARAALVAACAYHFGGSVARAQLWYEASRRHAIAEGDEAHLSALMHNQAWTRAGQVRMALLLESSDDAGPLTQALMGAESIGHYDAGIGTASLGSLVPMLRAQVLTAQGRWAEALDLFAAHFDSALAEGLQRLAACLLADRAWCELNLGHEDKARVLAGAAEQALAEPIHTDDRAMAQARLAQTYERLGNAAQAARHREESKRLHEQHRAQQRRLVDLLDGALGGVDPNAA